MPNLREVRSKLRELRAMLEGETRVPILEIALIVEIIHDLEEIDEAE